MSNIAVRVENLSKKYEIGLRKASHDTFRDQIMHGVKSFFSRNGHGTESSEQQPATSVDASTAGGHRSNDGFIWALKDVSFEIKHGEVVGFVGKNGAGKSTLLKILSRITEPTSGRAEIHGRVGSLLEVGTGFHAELTGRENIYLNGAILGMKKWEIDKKFDAIVAFAEIEKFIDTPVKRYSSGMYVRLAFAVAAHLEPEILIIDEVLAVGDTQFQKKCVNKIGDLAKQGRTVVFVSHNMATVSSLCDRVLSLVQGQVSFDGTASEGIQNYLGNLSATGRGDVDLISHTSRRAGSVPLLERVRLLDVSGQVRSQFLTGEPIEIELDFNPLINLPDVQFGIGIDDSTGTRIFSLATYLSDSRLPPLASRCSIRCSIAELPIAAGRYILSLSAGTVQDKLIDALDHVIAFDVEAGNFYGNGRIPPPGYGMILVRSRWSVVAGQNGKRQIGTDRC